jgi:hypothetical protein
VLVKSLSTVRIYPLACFDEQYHTLRVPHHEVKRIALVVSSVRDYWRGTCGVRDQLGLSRKKEASLVI